VSILAHVRSPQTPHTLYIVKHHKQHQVGFNYKSNTDVFRINDIFFT